MKTSKAGQFLKLVFEGIMAFAEQPGLEDLGFQRKRLLTPNVFPFRRFSRI